MSDNPQAAHVRPFCTVMLAALLGAALFGRAADRLATASAANALGHWLDGWTWRSNVHLILLRIGYFAILGSYVVAALRICSLEVAPATALATIPLVLMASVLPNPPPGPRHPRNGPLFIASDGATGRAAGDGSDLVDRDAGGSVRHWFCMALS